MKSMSKILLAIVMALTMFGSAVGICEAQQSEQSQSQPSHHVKRVKKHVKKQTRKRVKKQARKHAKGKKSHRGKKSR